MSALQGQVGGDHYKAMAIQPVQFIHANGIGYMEGCAIKYLCRHGRKGGREDLEKAIHFIQLLIEQQYGQAQQKPDIQAAIRAIMSPGRLHTRSDAYGEPGAVARREELMGHVNEIGRKLNLEPMENSVKDQIRQIEIASNMRAAAAKERKNRARRIRRAVDRRKREAARNGGAR